ncbi:hypothetical protein BP6252_10322 [Coleophoma cylindrospora]|uniref:Uncharacterized protein n=1 Tax=Coleophoma cylindrospora TaxID=1849047 RepID=A0A3D8QSK0_9HELO|nr:hypothetical protein BP6252_10322 [Coleophoma cylindrospora]
MLDMELLHHWTQTTGPSTFPGGKFGVALCTTFVELAFQHPFLMHQILSISALHLAQVKPELAGPCRLASATHQDQGLSLFQPALARLNCQTSDACFAFSALVTIHTWASLSDSSSCSPFLEEPPQDRGSVHIQWMKVHRGHRAVIRAVGPEIQAGVLAPMFSTWKGFKDCATAPLPPTEKEHLDAVAASWESSSLPASIKRTLDKALGNLRRAMYVAASSEYPVTIQEAALAWLSIVPEEFVQLIEERLPEAMLVLAYYTVLLKSTHNLWWCKGMGAMLLDIAQDVLGGEDGQWGSLLKWPIEQVLGEKEDRQGNPPS